uniref:DM13 domain-containing protein n=1 Tax=Elaeophora elaphi TaxID=1147741 RepID=A0A0R3S4W2_9BILA
MFKQYYRQCKPYSTEKAKCTTQSRTFRENDPKKENQLITRLVIKVGIVELQEENLNEMEFDVTQWHNTLWTKRNKHPTSKMLLNAQFYTINGNSSFVIHGDDCFKETVVGSLAIDANSPFAKEIPEEAFDERAEKGSYLMRPGAISIGIDCLELVGFAIYG